MTPLAAVPAKMLMSAATLALILTLQARHRFIDQQDMTDNVVFVGDSIIASMDVTEAAPYAINFGIGSINSELVLKALPSFNYPRSARAVVIHVGSWDVSYRNSPEVYRANMQGILAEISVPVVLTGLHNRPEHGGPESRTSQFNLVLQELCAARSDCAYVPSPLLGDDGVTRAEYRRDNVHPNAAGYSLWAPAIADGLARVVP